LTRSEITALRLLVCNFDGRAVAGDGVPEATDAGRRFGQRACAHGHMLRILKDEGAPIGR